MKLSHSAREMFELCGLKYYFHYNKRYRSTKLGSALVLGNSFDLALNELLLTRDLEKAKKVFLEDFSKYEHDYNLIYYKSDTDLTLLSDDLQFDLTSIQDEKLYNHYGAYYTLETKALKMLEAYEKEILPNIISVIAVQKPFNLELANGTVRGIIDLIAEIKLPDGRIVKAILDNKTTSQPYTKNSYATKEQTALYHAALPEYEYVGFLTVNKKTFKTQIIVGEVNKELVEEVKQSFEEAFKKIAKENFTKNSKACYSFGSPCQFMSYCNGRGFSEDIYEKIDEEET